MRAFIATVLAVFLVGIFFLPAGILIGILLVAILSK